MPTRRQPHRPPPAPANQGEFAAPQSTRLKPAGTAFRIGAIYQLVYRAANPPVSGIGFAATRDLVSFLRQEAAAEAAPANPLALGAKSAIGRTLAHGTSQSGRYLRDFVYRGFNEDEQNRLVFEGINPHVATARLFLNQRFAQPNRMVHIGHGFMFFPDVSFPFAYETQTDPFTGASDGILARCTARGNCPKVIHTNTGTEYWQSGQSLVTTDPLGQHDGTAPESVRIYHFAGTQHVETQTMPKGVCGTPVNTVDYRPLLRALLHCSPVACRRRYLGLVPDVDADGNETSGVRLPDIAVPTATSTGWAVRTAMAGAAGDPRHPAGRP